MPLTVLTGTVAIISLIVSYFGVEVSNPADELLTRHRSFSNNLFFLLLGWWAPFSLPLWVKDYLLFHIACAFIERRTRKETGDLLPVINEPKAALLTQQDVFGLSEAKIDALEMERRAALGRAVKKTRRRMNILPFLLGPIGLLPRFASIHNDLINSAWWSFGNWRKLRKKGKSKDKQRAELKNMKVCLVSAGATLFWLLITAATIAIFFLIDGSLFLGR